MTIDVFVPVFDIVLSFYDIVIKLLDEEQQRDLFVLRFSCFVF